MKLSRRSLIYYLMFIAVLPVLVSCDPALTPEPKRPIMESYA